MSEKATFPATCGRNSVGRVPASQAHTPTEYNNDSVPDQSEIPADPRQGESGRVEGSPHETGPQTGPLFDSEPCGCFVTEVGSFHFWSGVCAEHGGPSDHIVERYDLRPSAPEADASEPDRPSVQERTDDGCLMGAGGRS